MSEEAVVEAIADSSQAEFSESEGIDVDSVSNDLAADLFPSSEREAPTESEPELSEEQPEQQEQQAQPEPEPASPPPKTWPKEMHDHWGKTPKEVQDYWNTREKQMLDGLEQYRGDATFAKQIKETLNPYMATINALGVDAPTAIRSLLNADHQLRVGSPSQKAQYLQHLAKQYGVDLSGISQQEGQAPVDPRLQQLQDELHGLKQIIQTGNQQQLDEQRQKIQNEVNLFASDPKHPYFDEVSDEIVALLKSGATLEDAYEKAVWANPVTRQKEMTRLQTEQQVALKAKAIAEAEAKKKAASVNLRNRDSQRTPTGPRATMSGLDSALRETMREIKSRH